MDGRSHALIDVAAIALVVMAVAVFTTAAAFGSANEFWAVRMGPRSLPQPVSWLDFAPTDT